jgi:uncharacterized cupredoxin-like copper-binding protein
MSHLTIPRVFRRLAGLAVLAGLALGCGSAAPVVTPPIAAGTADHPREVNIIAKDYTYLPSIVDLVPGETVLFHVVNGGLDVHEVVIGDGAVQAAWETAEADVAAAGGPPGATPTVSVPPGLEGLRVVVRSGQRIDVSWSVPPPPSAGATATPLIVGCHIPGHWAKGMQVPIRFVAPVGG